VREYLQAAEVHLLDSVSIRSSICTMATCSLPAPALAANGELMALVPAIVAAVERTQRKRSLSPPTRCSNLAPAGTATTVLSKDKMQPLFPSDVHHRHDLNMTSLYRAGVRCFVMTLRDPVERLTSAFVYDIYRTHGAAGLYIGHQPVRGQGAHTIKTPATFVLALQSAMNASRFKVPNMPAQAYLNSLNVSHRMVHIDRPISNVGMRPFRSSCGRDWDEAKFAAARSRYEGCMGRRQCWKTCSPSDTCSNPHTELCGGSYFLIPQTDYLRGLKQREDIGLHVVCLNRFDRDWARVTTSLGLGISSGPPPEGPLLQGGSAPLGSASSSDGAAAGRPYGSGKLAAYQAHVWHAAHSNVTFKERHQRENPLLRDDFFLDESLARFVRECLYAADAALYQKLCLDSSREGP